jgi:hypothetical protein
MRLCDRNPRFRLDVESLSRPGRGGPLAAPPLQCPAETQRSPGAFFGPLGCASIRRPAALGSRGQARRHF